MSTASQNLTVTSRAAKRALIRCFKSKRPVFLWGPPGIGKSDMIAEITREMGGHMIDLRMATMEPTDLRGIPFFNKDKGVMDWAPPIELPDAELASQYPIIVLFLDEMNSAAPAIQAAGYQLVLNRRVGKYVLPDNVVIVAAGNRDSDKGVVYRMPSPLANRFVHLEMRVDHESWEEWAILNTIHKDVIGYLGFAKQDLFDFDPKSSSRSFATPRSWSFVSELVADESVDNDTLMNLISGAVGEGLARKFMAHRKISSQLPNPVEILQGKVKDLKIKEISAMYSLTISMCYELKDVHDKANGKLDAWHKMVDNFFEYMMANFSTELVVLGARTAITTYNLPITPGKLSNFAEFHKRFGRYVVAAASV
jgi:hypothetical protein